LRLIALERSARRVILLAAGVYLLFHLWDAEGAGLGNRLAQQVDERGVDARVLDAADVR
jgi:hypothetical protein